MFFISDALAQTVKSEMARVGKVIELDLAHITDREEAVVEYNALISQFSSMRPLLTRTSPLLFLRDRTLWAQPWAG